MEGKGEDRPAEKARQVVVSQEVVRLLCTYHSGTEDCLESWFSENREKESD
jgi:hypothetical protein